MDNRIVLVCLATFSQKYISPIATIAPISVSVSKNNIIPNVYD